MSDKLETTAKTDRGNTKNGEESFKEEIKDYAKTTMNELLGMFGYDDEMTSESVNNLEIKVPSTGEESSTATPSISTVTVTTPSLPLTVPDDTSDDAPVIVKVEGNTSVTDIIRQQNGANASTNGTPPTLSLQVTSATPTSVTKAAMPMNVTMTTQSETGQPALGNKTITGFTKPTVSTPVSNPSASGSGTTSLSPFLKSVIQSQAHRPCTWCKTNTVLKNFTFRDGTKILECRNICSQECFEMAALSIDLNNDNIKSIQWRIRQLRVRNAAAMIKQNDIPADVKKPNTPPVARRAPKKSKADLQRQVARPLFNWESYLRECHAKGAAKSYFKQFTIPVHNGFKPGMKLEVSDPRVIQSTCLATIVGSIGPRIRCGFDGTDKSNDVWHMVDSTEIHPVGWSEANNCQLQPPVGFTRDPGTYQRFVASTLAAASNDKIAPARLFKKEPVGPDRNMFQIGMKLEALDPKNQALVCVATVGGVNGDKIRIDFDGYMGSDYWCRYDSRNIFPVGWCSLNCHPLQPPGKKKRPNSTKKGEEPPTKKSKSNSKSMLSSSSSSKKSLASSTSAESSKHTVKLYINHGCITGRYLNRSKVAKLRGSWHGKCREVIRPLIQSLVDCAHDQTTVFGFLKPGNGKMTITARGDGYETYSCTLQNIDRVRIFWKVLEKLMENLQCCDNLISSTKVKGRCDKCKGKAISSSPAKHALSVSNKNIENVVSSNQVCSTSPVKTWSVDEVIKYIENSEVADHKALFKIHEIDGRALLLLNRDMVMSYMGLKLGPAIKLLSIVDDLKPKDIVEVE